MSKENSLQPVYYYTPYLSIKKTASVDSDKSIVFSVFCGTMRPEKKKKDSGFKTSSRSCFGRYESETISKLYVVRY